MQHLSLVHTIEKYLILLKSSNFVLRQENMKQKEKKNLISNAAAEAKM